MTYDIIGQNYDIIGQNYDIIVSTMISGVPRFQMHTVWLRPPRIGPGRPTTHPNCDPIHGARSEAWSRGAGGIRCPLSAPRAPGGPKLKGPIRGPPAADQAGTCWRSTNKPPPARPREHDGQGRAGAPLWRLPSSQAMRASLSQRASRCLCGFGPLWIRSVWQAR